MILQQFLIATPSSFIRADKKEDFYIVDAGAVGGIALSYIFVTFIVYLLVAATEEIPNFLSFNTCVSLAF